MMIVNDFGYGLGLGLAFGVMVGTSWEKAWEVVKEAHDERMEKMSHRASTSAWEHLQNVVYRMRRMTLSEIILVWVSIMLTLLGIFQIYAYSKQQAFIRCQADFNQQSSIARDARQSSADNENDALWTWVATLPPLLSTPHGQKPNPVDVERFKTTLRAAIKSHEHRIHSVKRHPYPPNPNTTCGNP
jgi:hypothetical protein